MMTKFPKMYRTQTGCPSTPIHTQYRIIQPSLPREPRVGDSVLDKKEDSGQADKKKTENKEEEG